jgi:hypothetical protein
MAVSRVKRFYRGRYYFDPQFLFGFQETVRFKPSYPASPNPPPFPYDGKGGGGRIGMVIKDEVTGEVGWDGTTGAHLPGAAFPKPPPLAAVIH